MPIVLNWIDSIDDSAKVTIADFARCVKMDDSPGYSPIEDTFIVVECSK
jgi:hypothetical protein